MRVLLIGAHGSMGKRYQAILKHLDVTFLIADKNETLPELLALSKMVDRVIVATPTHTHKAVTKTVLFAGKPVLCEKPMCKDLRDLEEIIDHAHRINPMLAVVMQYKELVEPQDEGHSYYNFFRHGNDGLVWDCFQIVALAKGTVELREESPIWECQINGRKLSLADMDKAYISMLSKWLNEPHSDLNILYELHQKVSDFECKSKTS